jgi:ureidoacrylate peracid hydrolase
LLSLDTRYYRWYPAEDHLGYAQERLALDPRQTAFLLVDVYCPEPDQRFLQGAVSDRFLQRWHDISVQSIGPALQAAREAGLPIIYTTNSGPRVGMERSEFGDKLRRSLGFNANENFTEPMVDDREYHRGDPVALNFPAVLEPQTGDYYVRKHVYSGFFDTRLDTLLRNLGVRNLVAVGFVADACLFFTVADAVFRNYKVILLRDCTMASERLEDVEDLVHTKRMLLCIETIICSSATSGDFVTACQGVSALTESGA